MGRIAVVTDTNSGITNEEAEKLGIYMINMPFMVNGEEFFDGINSTYEEFFRRLAAGDDVTTSQPAPDSLTELWDKLLTEYDEIVHIPMSASLSSSCSTARALAADYEGKVYVVDNKRISITQRESVIDALKLIEKGKTAAEVAAYLEENAFDCSIYLAVNTLELLKKSGRVTAAGAALANNSRLKARFTDSGRKA